MRLYDKIISNVNINVDAGQITLVFLNPKFTSIFDIQKDNLYWQLPDLSLDFGLPLSLHSDMDKLIIAYDSNKIAVFDTINKRFHPWTLKNMDKMPQNFLRRYNKIVGITQLTLNKFILWTHYTYAVLDLNVELPEEVKIVQDHPKKSLESKHLDSSNWFDTLKLSQSKYLQEQHQTPVQSNEQPSE